MLQGTGVFFMKRAWGGGPALAPARRPQPFFYSPSLEPAVEPASLTPIRSPRPLPKNPIPSDIPKGDS